jgi:hypothetical protein
VMVGVLTMGFKILYFVRVNFFKMRGISSWM